MLDTREGAYFYEKKFLSKEVGLEDSFEVEDRSSPGVGVPFSWEDKPGSRRVSDCATEDPLMKSTILTPPPPIRARDHIGTNLFDESSTSRKKWAPLHKMKIREFTIDLHLMKRSPFLP
jgi:hypothetical protein